MQGVCQREVVRGKRSEVRGQKSGEDEGVVAWAHLPVRIWDEI